MTSLYHDMPSVLRNYWLALGMAPDLQKMPLQQSRKVSFGGPPKN